MTHLTVTLYTLIRTAAMAVLVGNLYIRSCKLFDKAAFGRPFVFASHFLFCYTDGNYTIYNICRFSTSLTGGALQKAETVLVHIRSALTRARLNGYWFITTQNETIMRERHSLINVADKLACGYSES